MQLITVTAALAEVWLATSTQRRLDPAKVTRYHAAMTAGEWDPEKHRSMPVIFSVGRLTNGNHRCHAVVRHGRPVPMWVRGTPPDMEEFVMVEKKEPTRKVTVRSRRPSPVQVAGHVFVPGRTVDVDVTAAQEERLRSSPAVEVVEQPKPVKQEAKTDE